MSAPFVPAFYDDLELTLAHAWGLWVRGGADRRSPLHTPVVATVDADCLPQARVMVLRKADAAARTLRFHTDRRSAKAAELAGQTAVTVLGYDPAAKIQLRVRGTAAVMTEGDAVDQAWAKTGMASRKCYLAEAGPGDVSAHATSGLMPVFATRDPTEPESQPGRENFAILLVTVTSLEWLYLAAQGHRRARFEWNGAEMAATWLVP
jgi:pyridoxamine 5'-phosphate oxidase